MIPSPLKLLFAILIAVCPALSAQSEAMLGRSDAGDVQWVISQNHSPLSGQFAHQLWWLKGEPISSQGKLLGAWWDDSQLVLVYPRSAFRSDQQGRQLIIKAPRDQQLIALGSKVESDQWLSLLKDKKTGRFLRTKADTETSDLPVLREYEDKVFFPWSSPRFPALWFPAQEGLSHNELCLFSPDFSQCRLLPLHLEPNEGVIAFSEDATGLWLLPKKGVIAWKWDGKELRATEMPPPQPGQYWLSIAPKTNSWAGIQDGPEGMQLWLEDERVELPLQKSVPQSKSPERPLWLQWVFFAIMVTSFIAILNWRREGRVLAQRQKKKTIDNTQTASVTVRSLAFLLDMFILNIPLTLISQGLELPELSTEHLEGLAIGSTVLDETFILSLSSVLFYKLVLLLGLSFSYHLILEKKMGASLGKLFFHIQVQTPTGETPKMKALLTRGCLRGLDLILPIPPSLVFALFSSQKLSLADRVSNTRVLRLS